MYFRGNRWQGYSRQNDTDHIGIAIIPLYGGYFGKKGRSAMRVAVYCGSTAGYKKEFVSAAYELGAWLGKNGHELIYGGSNTGLMGALADGVLDLGGAVTGVFPNVPSIKCRVHPRLTTRIETMTLSERKATMIDLADAFLALPGGVGTLDEITEILSLESLNLVSGPVVFYSIDGYYESFKLLISNMVHNGFGTSQFCSNVHFVENLADIVRILVN